MSSITNSLDELMSSGFSFGNLQTGGVQVIKGKALDIPIGDVEPDPDQPRKNFKQEALDEMASSIRAYGVKSPVSVRDKTGHPGKYILNFGERRWRGSKLADKRLIPAFIDNDFDPYVQVIENIEREDLEPMDLALWIKGRLDAGEKKGAIAKKLGKDASYITRHCALLELPEPLQKLYDNGQCTDARAVYDLLKIYEQDAPKVEAFCQASTGTISQIDIRQLVKQDAPKEVVNMNKVEIETAPAMSANVETIEVDPVREVADTSKKSEPETKEIHVKKSKEAPLQFVADWEGKQVRLLLEEAQAGMLWIELIEGRERHCILAHSVKLQGVLR